jgi:DNA-binding response OmpR family regulator
MRMLLVEDDLVLADGLARALRRADYAVESASTAEDACRMLDQQRYDLIVLDLGLPDLDGSEVVNHLKAIQVDIPVLVLSARDGLEERVRLLDIGADDYMIKPAAMDEFLARVRAVLRRRGSESAVRMALGGISLDLGAKRAFFDGKPLELNRREWALAVFLARNPNRVIPKEEIAAALYGAGDDASTNTIDQIMSRFRKRVAAADVRLRTMRGLGYYFEMDDGRHGS